MAGAAADDELVNIVELLEHSGLTAVDQRRVHNALDNMIEGGTPDHQSILRLIEFAPGRIDDEEQKRQVLKSAGLATPARGDKRIE